MTNKENELFNFTGKPKILTMIPLSLQHIFAMVIGIVSAPIIVANVVGSSPSDKILLVQYALIFSGITTMLQLFPIGPFGARIPIIFGAGFGYMPALTSIASSYGLPAIFGAQIIGSIVAIICGLGLEKMRKFFPSVVAGTVVLTIGLSLYNISINYMAGGIGSPNYGSYKNWSVAIITLIVVIVASQFGKGYIKLASVLVGIIVGYIISLFLGIVDFTPIKNASLIIVPIPLKFGLEFHATAIVSMIIISIVNSIQAVGDITATTMGGYNREPTDKEIAGGIMGFGICNLLGSFFGAIPGASYSQNVGIVSMTKVVNRIVLAIAAVVIFLSGIFPKFAALMTTIPQSVLGGATIVVFGIITMTGIRLITKEPLTNRDITIVGLSLALGLGTNIVPQSLAKFPEWFILIFGKSPVVISAIVAFTLNIVLPKDSKKETE